VKYLYLASFQLPACLNVLSAFHISAVQDHTIWCRGTKFGMILS